MLKYSIENAKETLNYIYVHVIKAEGGQPNPKSLKTKGKNQSMVALKPIHKPANKQNISNHDGESSMANCNAEKMTKTS